jgi:anti-anti-sigma factor
MAPVRPEWALTSTLAPVAQWTERLPSKQRVAGSNPARGASEMQLNIETEIDDDTLNVRLAGDFDMGSVATFRSTVEGEQAPWRRVVVEMSDVGFMDSSGLQELVRLNNRARELGLEMVLAQPSQPVRRLLELTGLDAQFIVRG